MPEMMSTKLAWVRDELKHRSLDILDKPRWLWASKSDFYEHDGQAEAVELSASLLTRLNCKTMFLLSDHGRGSLLLANNLAEMVQHYFSHLVRVIDSYSFVVNQGGDGSLSLSYFDSPEQSVIVGVLFSLA
ncbi:hypothetical protein GOP47_0009107 [Adiantum capillus-veneris]|uniref:Uncharacterized protein n=1 Tax=Adiantum capillus-veneris TaxID=13818 RepID=A0A9D4V0F2_ADICA|nr:hypothetical protein GOP47_0009107 [Adiantum capillus-veneris]